MSKIILVPTDFTDVSDNAINHAIAVAQTVNGRITMVHIVPKKTFVEEGRTKLNMWLERINEGNHKVAIDAMVRVGTIFEDIGDMAEEIGAELIIMGSHGVRGMQFISGSRALKVITSSTTPFIVVQKKQINKSGYDDIVVPIDLSKETKQKLDIVAQIAEYFKSRVHLIIPKETDEFLKNQLDRNLNYAIQFFKDRGVECTTTISAAGSNRFDEGIMEHAAKVNADMIAIMNLPGSSLASILGISYVQKILTNQDDVPVLIVNPVDTSVSKSVLFS